MRQHPRRELRCRPFPWIAGHADAVAYRSRHLSRSRLFQRREPALAMLYSRRQAHGLGPACATERLGSEEAACFAVYSLKKFPTHEPSKSDLKWDRESAFTLLEMRTCRSIRQQAR